MKTKLVINEDLKMYLKEEIDRGNDEFYKELCKRVNIDSFSYQWLFKFNNGYGASVIKQFRFTRL